MSEQTYARVVRRFGSDQIHVAEVARGQFFEGEIFGGAYLGVVAPVVTLCCAVLRGLQPVICMNPGTRVKCRRCAVLTESLVALDDNHVKPGGAS
jgi:hypothetical protein